MHKQEDRVKLQSSSLIKVEITQNKEYSNKN